MVKLPVSPPDSFSTSGVDHAPSRWWTVFDNQHLDSLVTRALDSNFTLKTAWSRLRAAQAVADGASAGFFPTLDATAGAEVTRTENSAPSDVSMEQFSNEQLRLGLSSEYELDLWGRIRSHAEAERLRATATYADYRTAALSVSAEVVRTWAQLVIAQNQLALLNQQIDTNEQVLELLKARFGSGQIRSVDILRQRQLLESTREQKYVAETNIRLLEHQLTLLLGRPAPQPVNIFRDSLPELPPLPETGLPAELIRRRPDVQQAYHQLRAADRDLAAAISNQYPRLTFTASLATTGETADDLFQSWIASFAGNLLASIFRGGQLSAEVDRAEAVKNQRLYEYGQTTLVAFREVENALIRENKQRRQISSLEKQVQLARQAYEQLRIEYFNGVSDYIDVLTALTDEQQLQRDLLTARLSLFESRIALYRALAGGFQTHREAK